MWGLAPYHIKMLCSNSYEGGLEYTPSQVGDLTLDQIIMLLADSKDLRRSTKGVVRKYDALALTGRAGKDGLIAGRAADGTPIRARIAGKSLAQQMKEKREEKEAAEKKRSDRRRRRRGN